MCQRAGPRAHIVMWLLLLAMTYTTAAVRDNYVDGTAAYASASVSAAAEAGPFDKVPLLVVVAGTCGGYTYPERGEYFVDSIVAVIAYPDPGCAVKSWQGTLDDSSRSESNLVQMPHWHSEAKRVTVTFEEMVTFGDPSLETVVRQQLGFDDTMPVVVSDMLNLTDLDLSNQVISDLQGLEHASNLTALNLSDNAISDLSVLSHLTELMHLDLRNNLITDISVLDGFMNFSYLDLRGNSLDESAFEISLPAIQRNNAGIDLRYDTNQYFELTVNLIGGGAMAEPNSGTYQRGRLITIGILPGLDFWLDSWSGTDDDSSTKLTNTVTMNADRLVTVYRRRPVIATAPRQLNFFHPDGGPSVEPQVLSVWNDNLGGLNWQITEDCSWLDVWPTSGRSFGEANEVAVHVEVNDLDVGIYDCTLAVFDSNAVNSPTTVKFTLYCCKPWDVPGKYPTIQAAIDSASNGDTIVVGPFIFRENINFKGKAITVRGTKPDGWGIVRNTIVDGGFRGSCVVFDHGETRTSVLEGLTLINGSGTDVCYSYEGGSFCGLTGGGILCVDSSPTIRRCDIIGNGVDESRYCHAEYGGGLALLGDCRANIINCVIADNGAAMAGGAILIRSDTPEQANSAITNCTIIDNMAYFYDYMSYQVDCWDTQAFLSNTIIWSGDGNGSRSLLIADPLLVTYCCVRDAYVFEGYYNKYTESYDLTVAGGNISKQPRLVAPRFAFYAAERDYHLLSNSPCINTGDPNFGGAGQLDMDGQPRVMAGRIDIGADEVIPEIRVNKPAGGEVWASGSTHEINWSGHGAGAVDILFSEDGGDSWQVIETSAPDIGAYWARMSGTVDSNKCVISVIPSVPDSNVVTIESGLFTVHPDSLGPEVTSKWKSLGGNFQRTGLSDSNGPLVGSVKWRFDTAGPVTASVTIGFNERVHVACEDGQLYTLDANGVLLWSYDTNSPFLSSPTIGPDGSVYAGTENGMLYAIDANGNLRWTHTTSGFIYSSPAIGPDGGVYVCSQDGTLYALGPDGSELWTFETGGPARLSGAILASPATGTDGTVYIAGLYGPNLYALDPNDGSTKWSCSFGLPSDPCAPNSDIEGGWPFASPVIARDGTIYQTLLYDSNLYAIEPNRGAIIWSTDLADPCSDWFEPDYAEDYGEADGWSEPALGPDGTIYVSFNDPYLRAVDPNGSIKWVTQLGTVGGFTLSIGTDGLIYAASDDACLYVLDPSGRPVTKFVGDNSLSFPVIAANNTLIVGDADNAVWAIGWKLEDLNRDGTVTFFEFATVAADWLDCTDTDWPCNYEGPDQYLTGDMDKDLYVDLADLAVIADRWLANVRSLQLPPPPDQASNPNPSNGARYVDVHAVLSWTAGEGAASHDVYFGSSSPPPFVHSQISTVFDPGPMADSTTYFWRIDEVNLGAITPGVVWSFTVEPPPLPGQAGNPNPYDGATVVSRTADLSWTPGDFAVSHDVYFGLTDPPPFVQNQIGTTFDPGTMSYTTTYFWRIDEVNPSGTTAGNIWIFITEPGGTTKGVRCFPAHTPVWADGRLMQISELTPGQRLGRLPSVAAQLGRPQVESIDEHTGTFECHDIVLESGKRVSVVGSHLFLVESEQRFPSAQWLPVQYLTNGSKLKCLGGTVAIKNIVRRTTPFVGKVYNLKIKDGNRYIVGEDAIIVRDW